MCPMYSFIDENTGEEFEEIFSYSEKDDYLAKNPHIKQTYTKSPAIVRGNGLKVDSGFKDVLKRISKANRGSNINIP
jgi:hypothetical protein